MILCKLPGQERKWQECLLGFCRSLERFFGARSGPGQELRKFERGEGSTTNLMLEPFLSFYQDTKCC